MDVAGEANARASRDTYFSRNDMASTAPIQTKNPYGFVGQQNMIQIRPYLPVTQELDLNGRLPCPLDGPTNERVAPQPRLKKESKKPPRTSSIQATQAAALQTQKEERGGGRKKWLPSKRGDGALRGPQEGQAAPGSQRPPRKPEIMNRNVHVYGSGQARGSLPIVADADSLVRSLDLSAESLQRLSGGTLQGGNAAGTTHNQKGATKDHVAAGTQGSALDFATQGATAAGDTTRSLRNETCQTLEDRAIDARVVSAGGLTAQGHDRVPLLPEGAFARDEFDAGVRSGAPGGEHSQYVRHGAESNNQRKDVGLGDAVSGARPDVSEKESARSGRPNATTVLGTTVSGGENAGKTPSGLHETKRIEWRGARCAPGLPVPLSDSRGSVPAAQAANKRERLQEGVGPARLHAAHAANVAVETREGRQVPLTARKGMPSLKEGGEASVDRASKRRARDTRGLLRIGWEEEAGADPCEDIQRHPNIPRFMPPKRSVHASSETPGLPAQSNMGHLSHGKRLPPAVMLVEEKPQSRVDMSGSREHGKRWVFSLDSRMEEDD